MTDWNEAMMGTSEASGLRWRKSSHSGGGNGDCVEVAFGADTTAVRDSKNALGPTLTFDELGWRAFVLNIADRAQA